MFVYGYNLVRQHYHNCDFDMTEYKLFPLSATLFSFFNLLKWCVTLLPAPSLRGNGRGYNSKIKYVYPDGYCTCHTFLNRELRKKLRKSKTHPINPINDRFNPNTILTSAQKLQNLCLPLISMINVLCDLGHRRCHRWSVTFIDQSINGSINHSPG